MNLQARIEQERYFRDRDQVQVLIGTDAAGEGINLQFCRLMVNFDLPWNPNRLEQRMGRIHRYGQKRDCYVFNMLYPETREGRVLERLLEKLERMRERLGDSVYDVVGSLLEGVRLEELIMQAILREDTKELEHVIDVDVEKRLEEYRKALEESALAGHHIDLSAVATNERDSRQKRLVPWDVERFTRLVVPLVGGECLPDEKKPGVFRLRLPRTFLRQHHLPQDSFARGIRIAFERKTAREAGAEFFAPGHPLLDALCDHFLNKSRPVQSVLVHPGNEEGILWIFRARILDGHQTPVLERLLALFWDIRTGHVREVDLRMLWDLKPWPEGVSPPDRLLDAIENGEATVRNWIVNHLEQLQSEAQKRREREATIKQHWLEKSFDFLIRESNAKLFDYHRRAEKGEDLRLAIQQEEENLKRLIREQRECLEALKLEQSLTLLEPQLEAVVLICRHPEAQAAADVERISRIEAIGMEVAMQYEQAQGRSPEDVSKEYRGYDIFSTGQNETRYIEVKAFATTGVVRLTPHEWQMAQRLGHEYWLYIVENAESQPRLYTIRNPARLPAESVLGVVEVVIHQWKEED